MKKLISEHSILINITTVVTVLSAVFWFSWRTSEHFVQTNNNSIAIKNCEATNEICIKLIERITVLETQAVYFEEMRKEITDLHKFIIGK